MQALAYPDYAGMPKFAVLDAHQKVKETDYSHEKGPGGRLAAIHPAQVRAPRYFTRSVWSPPTPQPFLPVMYRSSRLLLVATVATSIPVK